MQGSTTSGGSGALVPLCDGGMAPAEVWTRDTTPCVPELNSVIAVADDFAIAVGNAGTILDWDGAAWSVTPSPTTSDLHRVWADSRSNVWAVGTGTILHWDGSAWQVQDFDGGDFGGLWGAADEAWATSPMGVVGLDPSSWRLAESSQDDAELSGATWGLASGDVRVLSERDGGTDLVQAADAGIAYLSTLPVQSARPATLWGLSDDDLFATGGYVPTPGADASQHGFVEQWNGTGWNLTDLSCNGYEARMTPVWAGCDAEVWVGFHCWPYELPTICRVTPRGCVEEGPALGGMADFNSISGSDHHIWAVGRDESGMALIAHTDR